MLRSDPNVAAVRRADSAARVVVPIRHSRRTAPPHPASVHQAGRLASAKRAPAGAVSMIAPATATPSDWPSILEVVAIAAARARLRARHSSYRRVGHRRVDEAESDAKDHRRHDDERQRRRQSYPTQWQAADEDPGTGDEQREARPPATEQHARKRRGDHSHNGHRGQHGASLQRCQPARALQVQGRQEQKAAERAVRGDRDRDRR